MTNALTATKTATMRTKTANARFMAMSGRDVPARLETSEVRMAPPENPNVTGQSRLTSPRCAAIPAAAFSAMMTMDVPTVTPRGARG